ncbi:MAG: hypothetical protein Q9188_002096 [Gyalolechia gomerana]
MADQASESRDEYILERDWRALARLHSRHFMFKIVRGYLLHPKVTLEPHAKIADIGTGSCIWPIDLLQELPFAFSVDAIDVSLEQCPTRSWLPNNINLIIHDAYQPSPEHMIGKYDLVHVQNFLCVWRAEKSKDLVRNLLALLKPGGFIQWSEQDPAANRVITAPGVSCSTQATEDILAVLNKPRQAISFEWVSQLGQTLGRHAALAAFDRFESVGKHQMLWDVQALAACEELASNLKRNAETDNEVEQAERLHTSTKRASIEMRSGVGIYSELVVAVAQKEPTLRSWG